LRHEAFPKNLVSLQTFFTKNKNTLSLKQGYKVALLIGLVLLIDQASKFYIKTNFEINEQVKMFGLEWARLLFVENEGMAFGIKFNVEHGDFDYGKLLLSLFRIIMVIGLIWYMRVLMRVKAPMSFVYCVGLITAGALGNIIDSTFYALIFSGEYHSVAQMTPFGQGYGLTEGLPMRGFLHGRVVDMFYFPITTISFPEWLGGGSFLFFSPIFNVADAAITTGILSILVFQRRFFKDGFMEEQPATPTVGTEIANKTEPQPEDVFEKTETSQEIDFEMTESSNEGQPKENGAATEEELPAESRPKETE
jgi:signal peptidase II